MDKEVCGGIVGCSVDGIYTHPVTGERLIVGEYVPDSSYTQNTFVCDNCKKKERTHIHNELPLEWVSISFEQRHPLETFTVPLKTLTICQECFKKKFGETVCY